MFCTLAYYKLPLASISFLSAYLLVLTLFIEYTSQPPDYFHTETPVVLVHQNISVPTGISGTTTYFYTIMTWIQCFLLGNVAVFDVLIFLTEKKEEKKNRVK